jgi:type II pantothenate kinase
MYPLSKSFSREVQGDGSEGGGRLQRVPPNPSDVKINVEGAFIVDDESPYSEAKNGTAGEGVYFENKDIRLPHHTAVVSHVAVDVSHPGLHTLCIR